MMLSERPSTLHFVAVLRAYWLFVYRRNYVNRKTS